MFIFIWIFIFNNNPLHASHRQDSTSIIEMVDDSLIIYMNNQDWSYLKASHDWFWSGELIITFTNKGVIKKVKSEIQGGKTHSDDIYRRTRFKFKRQVRSSLKRKDLSHLNPPPVYIVNVTISYNSTKKQVVWRIGKKPAEK